MPGLLVNKRITMQGFCFDYEERHVEAETRFMPAFSGKMTSLQDELADWLRRRAFVDLCLAAT